MKIDLNKAISLGIIVFGFLLFFSNITTNLAVSFISIIGMFLVWIFWNKVTDSFILNHLLYLISSVGIIVSASILVCYGIEPIGTRNGTLMRFHSNHIAFAMLVFFITLLPSIILNMKVQLPVEKFKINLKPAFTKSNIKKNEEGPQYIIDDEQWEAVSEHEALSGNYTID